MKHFIVAGIFNDPVPVPQSEVDRLLEGHKQFIIGGVNAGRVLCAGPRTVGKGGFIILRAESREELDGFLSTDPYMQNGILHFEVTEFTPLDFQDRIADWAGR